MDALAHQQEALTEITARGRALFRGDWRDLPVTPRWHSLMVGPTGTGKTAVATMAADAIGVSLIRISAPSWMPAGATNRSTRETISEIAEHVTYYDRTILFVDELDKLIDQPGEGASWKSYIRSEIFELADGRWPTGINVPDTEDGGKNTLVNLTEKLQQNVFILASGTFQGWFDSAGSRRSMGFGAEANPEIDELSADTIAGMLPRELANRFNSQVIRIPELQAADYTRIALDAENKLPEPMRQPFRIEVEKRLPEAIATKKGVRFLEEVVMEILKNKYPADPKNIGKIVKGNPDIASFW